MGPDVQGHRGPCWEHVGITRGPMWGHVGGSPGGAPQCLAQLKPAAGCSVPASVLCMREPQPFGSRTPPTRAFPAAPPATQSREVLSAPRRAPAPGRRSPGPCERNQVPVLSLGGPFWASGPSRAACHFKPLEPRFCPVRLGPHPFPVWGEGGQRSPVLRAPPLRGSRGEGGWPPVHLLLPPPSSPSRCLSRVFPSARLAGAGHSPSARPCRAAPHPAPLRTGGSRPLLLPRAWHRPLTSTACHPAGTSPGPTQTACAQRRTQ